MLAFGSFPFGISARSGACQSDGVAEGASAAALALAAASSLCGMTAPRSRAFWMIAGSSNPGPLLSITSRSFPTRSCKYEFDLARFCNAPTTACAPGAFDPVAGGARRADSDSSGGGGGATLSSSSSSSRCGCGGTSSGADQLSMISASRDVENVHVGVALFMTEPPAPEPDPVPAPPRFSTSLGYILLYHGRVSLYHSPLPGRGVPER